MTRETEITKEAAALADAIKEAAIKNHGAELTTAVEAIFKSWLQAKGGAGNLAENEAPRLLLDFIGQHGAARIQDLSDKHATAVCDRVGFKVKVNLPSPSQPGSWVKSLRLYILPGGFNEIFAGLDGRQAAVALASKGWLVRGDGRNIKKRPDRALPDWGWKRLYILDLPDGKEAGHPAAE